MRYADGIVLEPVVTATSGGQALRLRRGAIAARRPT